MIEDNCFFYVESPEAYKINADIQKTMEKINLMLQLMLPPDDVYMWWFLENSYFRENPPIVCDIFEIEDVVNTIFNKRSVNIRKL